MQVALGLTRAGRPSRRKRERPAVIRPVPAGREPDVPVTARSGPRGAGPRTWNPDADGFVFLPGASAAGRPVNPTAVTWTIGASAAGRAAMTSRSFGDRREPLDPVLTLRVMASPSERCGTGDERRRPSRGPRALDLPGPSRRIRVEPIRHPEPARRPGEDPRRPARRPQPIPAPSKPEREPTPA